MLYLSISIIILTIVVATLPSIGPIIDKEKKGVTPLGYGLFFSCLIMIVLNSAQIFLTQQEKDQNENDRELKETNSKNIIRQGIIQVLMQTMSFWHMHSI